jgi:hypothetical protein
MHDTAALVELEQRYLRDLWRTAVRDTVADRRIDMARFGPVQAAIVCEEPEEPLVNVVLGAAVGGAVEGGHLADAIEWVAAHGVDYRVRIAPGLPGSEAGERWLMERGHEQGPSWIKFARDASLPVAEEPPSVETFELCSEEEICEGFIHLADESFWGARWLGSCFCDLAEKREWRCYVGYGREDDERSGGAVMLVDGHSAELGALLCSGEEDTELQGALLCRCARDAAEAGCSAVFAEAVATENGEDLSRGAETLLRNGFKQVFTRTDWRTPRHHESTPRVASAPFGAAG